MARIGVGRRIHGQLLLLSTVLLFMRSTHAQSSRDDCMELMSVLDCWRLYPKVPICDGSVTKLVECGEEKARQVIDYCDEANYTEVASMMVDIYRARDNAICSSYRLRQKFRDVGLCWHEARTCVQDITFVMPRDLPYDCKKKDARFTECKRDATDECLYWIERLGKSMFRASPCGGAMIASHWIFLLVATLVVYFSDYISNG